MDSPPLDAALDEWNKLLPPSDSLRKWFAHKPEKFEEFARRYRAELELKTEELQRIRQIAASRKVTLLYGAKDPGINHAVVLLDIIKHAHL